MNDLKAILDDLTARTAELNPWEQGFVESVTDQYKRRGRLSVKQMTTINKIAARHDPVAVNTRARWRASYDDAKRTLAIGAARYYLQNPPYFGEVARRILDEADYIPSAKCFRKMTENKYVKRAIANSALTPVFSIGQLVRFRRNDEVRRNHRTYSADPSDWPRLGERDLCGKLGVVVSIKDTPGYAKGSRAYSVLPAGDSKPVDTLERRLMRCKSL